MTEAKKHSTQPHDLRKRAEEKVRVAGAKKTGETISPNEAKILHELQVHQIELEMQNEELRHRQEELETSRSQYFDLYDLAPVGYLTISEQGLILKANLTAATLLDTTRDNLIKQPLTRFFLPEDQLLYSLHRRQLLETGTRQSIEILVRYATDHPPFWALLQMTLAQNGESWMTLSDITDRKRAEESLRQAQTQLRHAEKLSAIGALSASFAHEFNNPLQGVMSVLVGVKKRTSLDQEDSKLVDMAVMECNRMKHLITSLLYFNRPASDTIAAMDIHAVIDSVLLLSKNEYAKRGIVVSKKYASDLPRIMAADDQIKHVLLNLLNNAVEACEDRGTVSIQTEVDRKKITIHIQDSGKGIPSENMNHLFEPFFSTKPEVNGKGLGLSTSYGIVKAYGGEITVQSKVGEGSIFSVVLPLERENLPHEKDAD